MAVTQPKSRISRGTPTSLGSSAPCPKITSCKFGKWLKTYITTKNRKRRLPNWRTPHNDLLFLIYHSQITQSELFYPTIVPALSSIVSNKQLLGNRISPHFTTFTHRLCPSFLLPQDVSGSGLPAPEDFSRLFSLLAHNSNYHQNNRLS